MNAAARRRIIPDGLPSRVYKKSGSYYWFPKGGSWIKLCRVEDGEVKMLERLAGEKKKREASNGRGDMPAYIDEYVRTKRDEHRESGWHRYGDYAKNSFADLDVTQIDNAAVVEFLKANWAEKLPMQRAMRAFLSGFFQWCRENRYYVGENPCNGIRLKIPKPRDIYITNEHFEKIRAELERAPMVLCIVDLCYLTVQRSTEVRSLRWKRENDTSSWVDRDNGVIHFMPSKTRDSSGLAVDWPITPDIDAVLERARSIGKIKGPFVLHTARGKFWSDKSALRVWKEACERAGVAHCGYTIKDIRAKALTDAEKAGYDIDALKVAAAHKKKTTTETYFKDRNIPLSTVRLTIPKSA